MVRYSDELIEEIRSRNDIVDIVSQYVVLKRSGRNFMGLCPFHHEKSPSFCVSPDKQIFHCFGCGVGGNSIHFTMKMENLDFKDALEVLANRAGIELPKTGSEYDDKKARLRARVFEINEMAANFYHENLYLPTSKIAQEYIKKRKMDNKTLKKFMIGYSGNFNELYQTLNKAGFTEEEILASSLVNKTDDGKFIDRFRKRLMFPIQDIRGKFIAFGGRVLDDSKPKYVNSPENIVYSKGRNLFALNVAKKTASKKLLIVEGYMDAISLHQRGIDYAVASLGTALTEAQGRLLRRTSEKVIIGYDADGAGQAATLRGLEILQNLGCDIRILQITGAKDPDEYIVKYGPERFEKCVEEAISFVEFRVKLLKQELNLEQTNDKIKFLKETSKILARVENDIEKDIYIDQIANTYQVSRDALYAEIQKLKNPKNNPVKKVLDKPEEKQKAEKKQEYDPKILKRESLLIYLLLNYPEESYARLKNGIRLEQLKIERTKKILEKLYEEIEKGNSNTNHIIDCFEEEDIIQYLSWVMAYDFEIGEVQKGIEDILNTYQREALLDEKNDILKMLEHPEGLVKEQTQELEKRLKELIGLLAKMK